MILASATLVALARNSVTSVALFPVYFDTLETYGLCEVIPFPLGSVCFAVVESCTRIVTGVLFSPTFSVMVRVVALTHRYLY